MLNRSYQKNLWIQKTPRSYAPFEAATCNVRGLCRSPHIRQHYLGQRQRGTHEQPSASRTILKEASQFTHWYPWAASFSWDTLRTWSQMLCTPEDCGFIHFTIKNAVAQRCPRRSLRLSSHTLNSDKNQVTIRLSTRWAANGDETPAWPQRWQKTNT